MTMILCGLIVLIFLQVQSVFTCPKDHDPCCPSENDCCNDGHLYDVDGCCKNVWNNFYVPFYDRHSNYECMCDLNSRRNGMCYFILRINLINQMFLLSREAHLYFP